MLNTMMMRVKLLREGAKLPTRGSSGSAGYDLFAAPRENAPDLTMPYLISPGDRLLIPTGIAVAIPADHYGRIAPRSGLALNWGIDVLAGVVDSDYRGELQVLLLNTGKGSFSVNIGDRIAQLICECYSHLTLLTVDGDLSTTERNTAGYGSTGR